MGQGLAEDESVLTQVGKRSEQVQQPWGRARGHRIVAGQLPLQGQEGQC